MDGRAARLGKMILRIEVVRSRATTEDSIGSKVHLTCIYITKGFQYKQYQCKQLSTYFLDTRWPTGTQEAFWSGEAGGRGSATLILSELPAHPATKFHTWHVKASPLCIERDRVCPLVLL